MKRIREEEFNKNELDKILEIISTQLNENTTIYLFGGAVMVNHKIKPTTKDIDIVVNSEKEFENIVIAAKKEKFIGINIPLQYQQFGMSVMLENPHNGWRLDLFEKIICGKFEINENVIKRSKQILTKNKLQTNEISFEDIFIMKSLTQRDRDLEDMKDILGFGLDFKIIENEINNQKFKFEILDRIRVFEDKYELKILSSKLRKESEEYEKNQWERILINQIQIQIKEGKTTEEIKKIFQIPKKEWKKIKEKIKN